MSFDPTINLGNILTAAGTIVGVLWAYHQWDKRGEVRHEQQKNQISNIDQKVDRVEMKIDENTKSTNNIRERVTDLNLKMEKHITADELVQREIVKRLDKIDDDR